MALVDPALAPQLGHLLRHLERALPGQVASVVCHGDLHAGQALFTPAGVALIDLDCLCTADPAYDLASLVAHDVLFGGDWDGALRRLDAVLGGYGSRPANLPWVLAAAILRVVPAPLRFLDPGWRERGRLLVSWAAACLGGGTIAGPTAS